MPTPADYRSPARGIYDVLTATTGFADGNWILAFGRFSPSPDRQVIIRGLAGRPSEGVVAIDYPSIQILIRGKSGQGSYEEAYARGIQVRDALHAIPSKPTAWPALDSCLALGLPQDLGYDDKDRPQFSLNFNLIVSYESSGFREAV